MDVRIVAVPRRGGGALDIVLRSIVEPSALLMPTVRVAPPSMVLRSIVYFTPLMMPTI